MSFTVVASRIRTVLRRKNGIATQDVTPVKVDSFMIHPGKREVVADGRRVDLTNLEFLLLLFLAKKPEWVFSRQQIVEGIRGGRIRYPNDRSMCSLSGCGENSGLPATG